MSLAGWVVTTFSGRGLPALPPACRFDISLAGRRPDIVDPHAGKPSAGLSSLLYSRARRCPNTIYFFMTTIRVKENEPFEVALRRFKRSIEKTGLLTELRAREFYEKPTSERKRKKAAAVKRHYKRIRSQLLPKKLY